MMAFHDSVIRTTESVMDEKNSCIIFRLSGKLALVTLITMCLFVCNLLIMYVIATKISKPFEGIYPKLIHNMQSTRKLTYMYTHSYYLELINMAYVNRASHSSEMALHSPPSLLHSLIFCHSLSSLHLKFSRLSFVHNYSALLSFLLLSIPLCSLFYFVLLPRFCFHSSLLDSFAPDYIILDSV